MQGYLLDTNICVFLFRGKYGVNEIFNQVGKDNCFVSDVTVAELKYGTECSARPEQNRMILQDFLREITIIPFEACVDFYAKEKARLRYQGTPIDDFDLLIGCTAVSCDLTLVTDNVKHFQRINNIRIENWIVR